MSQSFLYNEETKEEIPLDSLTEEEWLAWEIRSSIRAFGTEVYKIGNVDDAPAV